MASIIIFLRFNPIRPPFYSMDDSDKKTICSCINTKVSHQIHSLINELAIVNNIQGL